MWLPSPGAAECALWRRLRIESFLGRRCHLDLEWPFVARDAGGACTGDAIWGPSSTLKGQALSGCEVWALSPAWCRLLATLERGCWAQG